jgi:hypothetical protein
MFKDLFTGRAFMSMVFYADDFKIFINPQVVALAVFSSCYLQINGQECCWIPRFSSTLRLVGHSASGGFGKHLIDYVCAKKIPKCQSHLKFIAWHSISKIFFIYSSIGSFRFCF